jgi:HD-like signal output (HDOD) protein
VLASDRFNAPLIGTTARKMATIDHDERRVLGLDHCEVGWQICRRWNFSDILQEAVLRHHCPMKENTFSVPGAFVFLAHFVSYSDMSGDILSRMLPQKLLTRMDLTIDDLVAARKTLKLER